MNKRSILFGSIMSVFVLLACTAVAYAFEAYLCYEEYDIERGTTGRIQLAAEKAHAHWDPRTQVEVVRDFRAQGFDAQPTFASQVFVPTDGVEFQGKKLFPFGGMPNAKNVFCNEMGDWSTYTSDEHGFNNPKGQWNKGKVDIVLIGDSFVHGACLKEGDDMASQLRRAGLSTINVGIGGTGPLIYRAVQREYAKPIEPKYVFWFHYAVDIRDHVYEKDSPTLMRYLEDPNFSQNLISRQDEVTAFLRDYFENAYQKKLGELVEARQQRRKYILDKLIHNGLRLTKLRERIAQFGGRPTITEGREQEKLDLLRRILIDAKRETEQWGGRFVFVYLPDWYTYAAPYDTYGIKVDSNFLLRQDVLKLVASLDIPIIDIQSEVFDKNPDPVSLYNFRMYGHYTLEGYTKITERLLDYVRTNTQLLSRR